MILKNFIKKIKIWHLLCGITFWTIWIECKDKVFSQEEWYESKGQLPHHVRQGGLGVSGQLCYD